MNIKEEIEKFKKDRVWVTKKSRMNAEQRMNRNYIISQIIINYYTFFVLAASIWAFSEDNEQLNILTLIMSIGLFGVSIFVNSMNYKEKAIKYKDSYLKLNNLEFQLQELLESDRCNVGLQNKLHQYRNIYNSILELTDNHSSIDYAMVSKSININDYKSNSIIRTYWFTLVTFNGFLFLAPIFIFISFWVVK